ncbi:GspH/FimT family pseudopilin [Shewanella mangrovisoli]|uniref:GspH/FimT family pseudopilin n=1 Tax=Shewanella mangrovisoli TaxID=2864211 RepID=UPI0035B88BF0
MAERTTAGFTLVELLVTIAIIGILASIALPSYRDLIARESLTSTANELISSYKFARGEAIKRNQAVTLEATEDGRWLVISNQEQLKVFSPSNRGVSMDGFNTLNINATGNTTKTQMSLENTQGETLNLCILPSGQSYLQEAACA